MQRHRKYLVVTIWISTIAFVGAGFVGWGQYSYGEKAKAIAKVGDVDVSMRELQQAYSGLYNQYNQVFQGNFDEAQAKSFGLQKQAMKQLVDQALILNLAESYQLRVTDKELLDAVTAQDAFFKDGAFDKETYRRVLKQNNLSIKEYEEDMRKSLLIQKTLGLFSQKTLPLESKALQTALGIADKVDYKVLSADMITIDTSDEALKSYWEMNRMNYMTLPSYELSVITQSPVGAEADEAALNEYYTANRNDFADSEGKLLSFEEAKEQVIAALDDKATRKAALKTYIAFKKDQLEGPLTPQSLKIDENNHPYSAELFGEITALTPANPHLKPRKIGNEYKIIKLVGTTPSQPKEFEDAKSAVLADYANQQKQTKLRELAENSLATFTGITSPFVTREYSDILKGLNDAETKQFLNALFDDQSKRGFITLSNDKIVLYHIVEQKLLQTSQTDQENSVMRLKATLFDQGLIKLLESKYSVDIYLQGL